MVNFFLFNKHDITLWNAQVKWRLTFDLKALTNSFQGLEQKLNVHFTAKVSEYYNARKKNCFAFGQTLDRL